MTVVEMEKHLPAGYGLRLNEPFLNPATGNTMKFGNWQGAVWLFYRARGAEKWYTVREATVADVVAMSEAAG